MLNFCNFNFTYVTFNKCNSLCNKCVMCLYSLGTGLHALVIILAAYFSEL